MQTILVLFGGCSTEYEVSLQSAHGVLSHLDRSRFTPLTVGITREGRWLRYGGSLSGLETGDWASRPDCVPRRSPSSTARTGRTAPSRACWS